MIATIFDTETTHLVDNHVVKLDRQPHLLEFYGCHVDLESGQTLDEIEYLIRPPREDSIDLEVSKKSHGITWNLVKDKPRFQDVAGDVLSFLEGQECVIIESMKMEMPVEAPHAGVIEAVLVKETQSVAEGDGLFTLSAGA